MTQDVRFMVGEGLVVVLERPTPRASLTAGRALGSVPRDGLGEPDLIVRWPAAARDREVSPLGDSSPWTLTLPPRDADRVPTLRSLAFLMHLERGLVPLHAAIGIHAGHLVAIAGPEGAGKTGLLLATLEHGLRPWAAEWILLGSGRAIPLEHAIRLRARHLLATPVAREWISPVQRWALLMVGLGAVVLAAVGQAIGHLRSGASAGRRVERAATALARRAAIDVPLARIGPVGRFADARRAGDRPPGLDILVLLGAGESQRTSLEAISPSDAARRATGWMRRDLDDLRTLRVAGHDSPVDGPSVDIDGALERYRRRLGERLVTTTCLHLEAAHGATQAELGALLADRLVGPA